MSNNILTEEELLKKLGVSELVEFYKEKETDKVYHVDRLPQEFGPIEISFDKKKIYNLWRDYPHNMTAEEVEIFDKENPYWAEFFASRKTEEVKEG